MQANEFVLSPQQTSPHQSTAIFIPSSNAPPPREISFVVHGTPRPQGSKKLVGQTKEGRGILVESSKYLKPWRNLVGQVAAKTLDNQPVMTGPVSLSLNFHFARPKSHYRTGKNAHLLRNAAPTHHTQRPDADKLTRAIADAITAIVIRDDSQICEFHVTKQFAADQHGSGVRITVKEMQ